MRNREGAKDAFGKRGRASSLPCQIIGGMGKDNLVHRPGIRALLLLLPKEIEPSDPQTSSGEKAIPAWSFFPFRFLAISADVAVSSFGFCGMRFATAQFVKKGPPSPYIPSLPQ